MVLIFVYSKESIIRPKNKLCWLGFSAQTFCKKYGIKLAVCVSRLFFATNFIRKRIKKKKFFGINNETKQQFSYILSTSVMA